MIDSCSGVFMVSYVKMILEDIIENGDLGKLNIGVEEYATEIVNMKMSGKIDDFHLDIYKRAELLKSYINDIGGWLEYLKEKHF